MSDGPDTGALVEKLGIVFVEGSADRVVAEMPVTGNTQPDGWLHGGATMSLIETVGSVGAGIAAGWPEVAVLGLQQTCNFLGTVREGRVRAVATPIHKGRTTHLWDIDVTSVETGKRIAAGRLTLAVRDQR
ncbi:MAG: PaaI family thioesterase [Actinomycetota bacterium]